MLQQAQRFWTTRARFTNLRARTQGPSTQADSITRKYKLVGYEQHSKAYRVLLEDTGKSVGGWDITHNEAEISHVFLCYDRD